MPSAVDNICPPLSAFAGHDVERGAVGMWFSDELESVDQAMYRV